MREETQNSIKVLIVGAGEAGCLVAENIARDKESSLVVIGFLDDGQNKKGKMVAGKPVLGTITEIGHVVSTYGVKEVIIAIPSQRGLAVRKVIEASAGLGVTYKILPRISEVLIQGYDKDYLRYIRKVTAEDLLGGEIVKKDQEKLDQFAHGKTFLITGAAGSIGSELSRQLAAYGGQKIIFYDWWENGMFELQNYITENYPEVDCEYVIGDIKDRAKLNSVMDCYQPDVVLHAAAYKHVPLMEVNAIEAIKNNIFGTKMVAELSIKHGVKKFILISSDKAVNPTNIMGATKRAAEKVIHILAAGQKTTTFCAVRFGNVINSNGSAIPVFERQIEKGGPVTVTHREITRFFMTISEAVHLVLQAGIMGENDDLFVLDMGEPIKIIDLAKDLIALHGYVPEKDIKIKITGLRPGEKLYEEVLVKSEEVESTKYKKIFRTKNYHNFDQLAFLQDLTTLKDHIDEGNYASSNQFIKEVLRRMISTYQPQQIAEKCKIK